MSEHEQQCAYVEWFKMAYPQYRDCIISIPNGSHIAGNASQRARKMARMKKEGLKPGASDLFIAVPRGAYSGLWLEMKDAGKTLCSVTDDQKKHLELMMDMGYYAQWAPGFEKAKIITEIYFG